VLPVSNAGHDHSCRCAIAAELIRDDYARPPSTGAQQLTKEADRGVSVTLGLHQNVDHCTVLIDGSP
jgi:hypothetical protein